MARKFDDLMQLWSRFDGKVCILGSGPSMDQYEKDYFRKNYDIVIGVNWIYERFEVLYNVATHFKVVHHFWENDIQTPVLVYSRQTSDVGGMANNPKAPGVVFEADEDLWVGASTIITAIHLASKITKTVDLYGVDLKVKSETQMYCEGYRMETIKKPSNEHFEEWAEVVRRQIRGMVKMTGITLIQK